MKDELGREWVNASKRRDSDVVFTFGVTTIKFKEGKSEEKKKTLLYVSFLRINTRKVDTHFHAIQQGSI